MCFGLQKKKKNPDWIQIVWYVYYKKKKEEPWQSPKHALNGKKMIKDKVISHNVPETQLYFMKILWSYLVLEYFGLSWCEELMEVNPPAYSVILLAPDQGKDGGRSAFPCFQSTCLRSSSLL